MEPFDTVLWFCERKQETHFGFKNNVRISIEYGKSINVYVDNIYVIIIISRTYTMAMVSMQKNKDPSKSYTDKLCSGYKRLVRIDRHLGFCFQRVSDTNIIELF